MNADIEDPLTLPEDQNLRNRCMLDSSTDIKLVRLKGRINFASNMVAGIMVFPAGPKRKQAVRLC